MWKIRENDNDNDNFRYGGEGSEEDDWSIDVAYSSIGMGDIHISLSIIVWVQKWRQIIEYITLIRWSHLNVWERYIIDVR